MYKVQKLSGQDRSPNGSLAIIATGGTHETARAAWIEATARNLVGRCNNWYAVQSENDTFFLHELALESLEMGIEGDEITDWLKANTDLTDEDINFALGY